MKRNLFVTFLMIGVMTVISSFTTEKVTSDEQQQSRYVSAGVELVFMGGSANKEDATVTLINDNTMVVEVHGDYISRIRVDWIRETTRLPETWYSGDHIPLYLSYGEYVEIGLTQSVYPYQGRVLRYKLVYTPPVVE